MKKWFTTLNSKQAKQALGVVFIVLLMGIAIAGGLSPKQGNRLRPDPIFNKTTGWTLISNNQQKQITLPYKEQITPGVVYQIKTTFNDKSSAMDTMLLRSSMQDFVV